MKFPTELFVTISNEGGEDREFLELNQGIGTIDFGGTKSKKVARYWLAEIFQADLTKSRKTQKKEAA